MIFVSSQDVLKTFRKIPSAKSSEMHEICDTVVNYTNTFIIENIDYYLNVQVEEDNAEVHRGYPN